RAGAGGSASVSEPGPARPPSGLLAGGASPALAAIFLISGAAGLIYEVVWTRKLLLVFGSTSFAVGTVLAAFMGGLALGSRLLGRRADRSPDCLRLYAGLEFAIGAYGIASSQLVELVNLAYAALHAAVHPGFAVSVGIRLGLAGAFILLPTALMGGTLPVLVRHVHGGGGGTAARVGALYAVNTAGAVVGTVLGGLVLMPLLGVDRTLLCAGFLNLLAGALALALRRAAPAVIAPAPPVAPAPAPALASAAVVAASPWAARAVLLAAALSGFASFLYEVSWTRTLHMIVGSTHDALTVMLAAFLVGIAAGSAAIARFADRVRDPARLFLALEFGIGIAALLVIPLLGQLPYILLDWQATLRSSHALFVTAKFLLSLAAMLAPALLIGATFPVAARLFIGDARDVGGRLGRLYLWNTLGCICGALGAAFLLIPALGALGTTRVGVVANALAGLAVAGCGAGALRRWPAVAAGAAALAATFALAPAWDRAVVTSAPYMYAYQFEGMDAEAVRRLLHSARVLYDREGIDSVVTVRETSVERFFQINGKTEASTGQLDPNVLLAEIPLQLHPEPQDALVIGWGMGVAVGAFTQHESIGRIDVVELEAAVLGAADFFRAENHDARNDPRVHVRIDDGRNFVALADRKWDIIASDPPDCWVSGPSHLFTIEHLRNVKAHLRPGGILSQWVAISSLRESAIQTLLRTYAEVFTYVEVWNMPRPIEQIVLASDTPLVFDVARFRKRLEQPRVRRDLERIGVADPVAFAACRLGAIPRAAWSGAELHTDDQPVLEFTPRINFLRAGDPLYAWSWLASHRGPYVAALSGLAPEEEPVFLRELARRLLELPDVTAGAGLLRRAAELAPRDPDSRSELARLLLEAGRPDLALAPAEEALALVPEQGMANFLVGVLRQRLGRPEQALEPLRKALAQPPADPLAGLILGRSLAALKRWDEARAALEAFLQVLPEDRDGLGDLSYVYEQQGDAVNALALAERALAQDARPAARAALTARIARLRGAGGR
ncbi:MAG: fused MFS/spermidine synthase, partial [Planctomycetes bacterium]|nr:fused MFS/spermidine synthase [Planctomycetota bacterium]